MSPETPISGLEAPPKQDTPKAAAKSPEPEPEPVLADNGHADRASFLALVDDLEEDTVKLVNSDGKELSVLVRELTGAERADLITLQAEAYQKGSLKIREYEQKLLLAGVADPTSPKGMRQPLLKPVDADRLMKMGASKVQRLVGRIEELSSMGAASLARAEGNSVIIPSAGSTSG